MKKCPVFNDVNLCELFDMQKLKTRVVRKNLNPEWNEDLTLSILDPNLPIKLVSIFFLFGVKRPIYLLKTMP